VESVPAKYRERYLAWKNDLLSTETGRGQWEAYASSPRFTLTVVISDDDRHGAGTSGYKWDDAGQLVAATITLGSRIDEGYPNPIYYPVMYSLSPLSELFPVEGNVLAAAKIAHELGHVKQAASTSGELYRLQNQLMPVYNQTLLSNGRDTNDKRLTELALRMGGTPVQIWENREYWGEVNAMLYLRERFKDEEQQRALFTRVRRTVEQYAKDYAERFEQVTQ
jgi:YD repeat-containing protein